MLVIYVITFTFLLSYWKLKKRITMYYVLYKHFVFLFLFLFLFFFHPVVFCPFVLFWLYPTYKLVAYSAFRTPIAQSGAHVLSFTFQPPLYEFNETLTEYSLHITIMQSYSRLWSKSICGFQMQNMNISFNKYGDSGVPISNR